jgi:hypothetical protein
MTCRNNHGRHQNRGCPLASGEVWEKPVYCPGGVRHTGGASLTRALVRNVGTCRADEDGWPGMSAQPSGMTGLGVPARSSKGDPQAAGPARGRVPMQRTGADRLAVALKLGNASRAKGAGRPGWSCGPTTLCGRSPQGSPQPGTAAWAPRAVYVERRMHGSVSGRG